MSDHDEPTVKREKCPNCQELKHEIADLVNKLAEAERQWHHWEDMYGVALAECVKLKDKVRNGPDER